MLEVLAGKLASKIKQTVPEHPASQAVLQFAISVLLNALLIILLTLAITVWTGKTPEAVQILISFALLRQLSGGLHLKSGMACVLFTTSLFTLLSLVHAGQALVLMMNGISLLLVLLLAPANIERQTRIPKRHYPKLKLAAAILVALNFVLGSPVVAASFLAQSISLLLVRKEG
ncbi:accessory gene regulator B family protein [Paenibacillus tengchongensis]|uniref:accessory gene regulator B family protein n=1 Tax=Paenibacillus tengchongensis TaxID=2608684 RepID=UPI00124DF6AF|nr:accessory gene regulator B family protein [Paenibacillus tengchongensis]